MVDHLCNSLWVAGSVESCPSHNQRGRSAVDVRPFNDQRTRNRTEGVAKTGQVSKQGTVTHTDYWSGKLSVVARPATLNVKATENDRFMDTWAWRNGRWIHRQTGTVLAWQTTASPSAPSVRLASNVLRSSPPSGRPRNANRSRTALSPSPSVLPDSTTERSIARPSPRIEA